MVLASAVSAADSARADVTETAEPTTAVEAPLLGGTHWRFETPRGPVHVWQPDAYDHETAGIVVYVHGYRTNVDTAWREHALAEQFAASNLNALFIAPEAPAGYRDGVNWPSLGRLIREVRRQTGLERPWGHVVAVGHSGAYRTILRWLDYRDLNHVVLLDGLYGHEEQFERWLGQTRHGVNRLILVSADTLRWTEPFVRQFATRQVFDFIPDSYAGIPKSRRRGQLLYMRSQFDHMGIVTSGKTIPVLLGLTQLPALVAASR